MDYLTPTIATQSRYTELQAHIQGNVLTPEDPQYNEARKAWNLTVDQHPAVIVVARSVHDVVEAVQFARSAGLDIAVQSTGHGVVRPADNSLLIITSQLTRIRVDAKTQTAWVEAGAKWGMVLEKTQAVGLAPLLGSSPDVGVVGYTLGGGMGWLARKYGLATDSVRYFEVVTAEGELIHASQDQNPDLFWGLRGGGGNFGVITGMEIQLYPVTTVYGGNLFYPANQAKAVISRYREWIQSAPDELTSSFVIMNFPPIPAIPEPLRGQSFVMIRGCYAGPVEQGEALLKFWRDWQAPVIDDFKAMPFSAVATISNDPVNPSAGKTTGLWLRDLSDETIDTLIQYGVSVNGSSPLVVTEVRHAGGAISEVSPEDSAYGNRDAKHIMELIAITPTPEAQQATGQYMDQVKHALGKHLTGGVYLNFMGGEDALMRTRDGYTVESYRRLQMLKAKYDPENRFSHSFNLTSTARKS